MVVSSIATVKLHLFYRVFPGNFYLFVISSIYLNSSDVFEHIDRVSSQHTKQTCSEGILCELDVLLDDVKNHAVIFASLRITCNEKLRFELICEDVTQFVVRLFFVSEFALENIANQLA